jgi:hypothetical protein
MECKIMYLIVGEKPEKFNGEQSEARRGDIHHKEKTAFFY